MPPRIGSTLTPSYRRHFIRQWREHSGLSQDQAVERVRDRVEGFSKASLSRIENFKQPYSEPILDALAWAFGCEPADLLMRDPENESWRVIEVMRRLDDEALEQIARIAATFRKAN